MSSAVPTLSIVMPVYNEAEGIDELLSRLSALRDSLKDISVEVIFVDDHSEDATPELLKAACAGSSWMRYFRLARNRGAHVAVLAGLAQARGECAVALASDLQDPPELIPRLLEQWRQGHRVVWAVRSGNERRSAWDRAFSAAFYWVMNRFSEVRLPPTGSDFALLDRSVIRALLASVGASPTVGAEIARLGFPQAQITYVKEPRRHGHSKWTRSAKIRIFIDAMASFSFVPMRMMTYAGATFSLLGFLYALFIIVMRILGGMPIQGWASLMVVLLVLGGIQMIMLGVLGEYLWRTLEETRRRPLYFIEDSTEAVDGDADRPR
jgi:polyisoprenyl-phosphate glycosyltransferase